MGGRRKYSSEVQRDLNVLRSVHQEYVTQKRELRIQIEAEYSERLRDYEFQESRLMNKLLRSGAAKTDISHAVSLSDWRTLEKKYELTADEFENTVSLTPLERYPNWSMEYDRYTGWWTSTVLRHSLYGEMFEGPIIRYVRLDARGEIEDDDDRVDEVIEANSQTDLYKEFGKLRVGDPEGVEFTRSNDEWMKEVMNGE